MNRKGLALSMGLAALGVAAAAFLASPGAATAGPAAGGKHPHFDDGGALTWSTQLADAQKAAKAADKLIFVEYGREA